MADKHIQLNSRLSSVAAFWKPDSPDEVTTGYLTVDDDGNRLENLFSLLTGTSLRMETLFLYRGSKAVPSSGNMSGCAVTSFLTR
jgi:hypothetical protein